MKIETSAWDQDFKKNAVLVILRLWSLNYCGTLNHFGKLKRSIKSISYKLFYALFTLLTFLLIKKKKKEEVHGPTADAFKVWKLSGMINDAVFQLPNLQANLAIF